ETGTSEVSAIDSASSSSDTSGWFVSSCVIDPSGQIGAAASERDGEAAVDDPDFLDVGGDERWQKTIQRHHQRRRILVAHELFRKAIANEADEDRRQRQRS